MLIVRQKKSRDKKQASQKAGFTVQIIEHNSIAQEMKTLIIAIYYYYYYFYCYYCFGYYCSCCCCYVVE